MAIKLKSPEQIEKMRAAGRLVRLVLNRLHEMVRPGVTTEDLDREAQRMCLEHGGECLFKGVPGRGRAGPFPGAICASLNEEVVHGIPSPRRVLREGDLVSIDFGVRLAGWCGDATETYLVGEAAPPKRRLVDVTRQSLVMAIAMCRPGAMWSEIAGAMESYVKENGFSVVREFVGHGIGSAMHEDPKIPNYVSSELRARDIMLKKGMVLAIEPMVNMGGPSVVCAADGWTVLTADRLPSAHFEHTVAITASDADVLTDGR